jgi:hypothetical protein
MIHDQPAICALRRRYQSLQLIGWLVRTSRTYWDKSLDPLTEVMTR